MKCWITDAVPSITGEADAGAVVEQHSDGAVRQLETEAVLVGVINPLGNE